MDVYYNGYNINRYDIIYLQLLNNFIKYLSYLVNQYYITLKKDI